MPYKTGVLREDEMRLLWLVLLFLPFPLPYYFPGFEFFRFYNWDNSRRRRDFRSGRALLPFPVFPIFRFRRYHAIELMFLRRYAFAVTTFSPALPCAPAGINRRHNTCACVLQIAFGLPRDRISFRRAFYAQTPNTALFPPRQTSRPGIHSAVLYHDCFIRSCLFE